MKPELLNGESFEKIRNGFEYKIEELPTKLCYCRKTNKFLGEFKTSTQLAELLSLTKHQAIHYLRGDTKVGRELYRFVEKGG